MNFARPLPVLAAAVILCAGLPVPGGEPAKPAGGKGAVAAAKPAEINPWHRPEGSIVGKTARFYLWYEEGSWSLRAAAQIGRQFSGTIRVIGEGKIKAVLPVGLKDKGKGDAWAVNAERNELKFHFTTGMKSDGFDIKLEGDSGELEFELLTADKPTPGKSVFVGKDEQHPTGKSPFRFPLAPPKPKAKASS